jgi:transcriptional regulator with XRE-family HTH domain
MPSRTDPARADQEAEVLRLKRENPGMSQRAIAAELGVSQATVHRYLTSGLDRIVAPEVAGLREASYARLSALLPVHMKRAAKGDDRATDQVRKLDESIRRLYGVDSVEPLTLVLARQTEDTGALVADALTEALDAYAPVLGLAPHEARWRVEMEQCARDTAVWVLGGREGPRPMAPHRPAPPAERVELPHVVQPSAIMPGPGSGWGDEERRLIERAILDLSRDDDQEATG